MLNKKVKDWGIFLFKIILSVIAVIYVLNRIHIGEIASVLRSVRLPWLGLGLVFFVASKVAAACRTLLILRSYDIPITRWENLVLYWAGMFYNLFLPGGIGGDVYKTAVINKLHANGLRISAGTVLMDRIAGVSALTVLASLSVPFTPLYDDYGWIAWAGTAIALLGFIFIVRIFTPRLTKITAGLLGWSFVVQGLQVLCVLAILSGYAIHTNLPEYLLIFLVSSLAAMLPVSVGGIGVRELVFLHLSSYFLLDQGVAVTISFTFYLITLFASSWGLVPTLKRKKDRKPGP